MLLKRYIIQNKNNLIFDYFVYLLNKTPDVKTLNFRDFIVKKFISFLIKNH